MEFLLSQIVLIKFRNFLFLVVFSSFTVFLLTSCEKDNEFGIEINPDYNTLGAIYSDTFSIHTFSVISDSIRTDELNGPSPLGNYIDPVFGEVNASIITQIRLEQSYSFIPDNGDTNDIVIDSVVLYLAIDGYYGDIDEQEFKVEILDEDIFKDSTYYNTTNIITKTEDISNGLSIESNPLFPGYFSGSLVDKAILGIPLNIEEFARPIVNESGNSTLDGNDGDNEFLTFFKGIKISSSKGINGGLYYINLLNSFSRIRLFYRDTSGISSEHDTLDFDFNINSNCGYFHKVEHDYTGTEIENIVNQPSLGQNQFFIQTLGGVDGRITIPSLDSLIAKPILINKAEIILPFEDYLYDDYPSPSSLFISRKNSEGEYEFLPDLFEGSIGGNFNVVNKNYTFNITRHLNEVVSEKAINDTIRVFPNGNGITANRVVLNGMNSTKKDKAKVVISYTKY
tara:strand:- start:1838 stop:3199 length:1362 start_codon:yes stop_codon:yes gene_type:complete